MQVHAPSFIRARGGARGREERRGRKREVPNPHPRRRAQRESLYPRGHRHVKVATVDIDG